MEPTKRLGQREQGSLMVISPLASWDFLGLGCAFFLLKIVGFNTAFIT
jgi:hypothetical protein